MKMGSLETVFTASEIEVLEHSDSNWREVMKRNFRLIVVMDSNPSVTITLKKHPALLTQSSIITIPNWSP